jgi:hypothetical protein
METKSARLLALLLTIIMLGSVLAYAVKQSNTLVERDVKFEFPNGFSGYISYVPSGADQVIYVNYDGADAELRTILNDIVANNLNYDFFKNLRTSGNIHRVLISIYPGMYPEILFLINTSKSKVYFSYDSKEEYLGYTVKTKQGISLVESTSPFILGTSQIVVKTVELISSGGKGSLNNDVGKFITRLPGGDYNLVMLLQGNAIKGLARGNATDFFDFYFAGYRINQTQNGTFYEKVVAMNFTKNGWFVKSNKTLYYNYTNFKDGLSVAIMRDTNLTKLMSLEPEMRRIEIKPVQESSNSGE